MPTKRSLLVALVVSLSAPAHGAEEPRPLERRSTGVTAAPQSLSAGAGKIRVNKQALQDFNPPPVDYVPVATPPAPSASPAKPAEGRFGIDFKAAAAKKADAQEKYEKQKLYTARTDACPKATEAEKREAHERLDSIAKYAGIRTDPAPRRP